MNSRIVVTAAGLVLASALEGATALAQTTPADIVRELSALRAEVQQLRAEVDALKRAVPPEAAPPAEMVSAQIAELAQVKVESTSRFPLKIFGTIQMNLSGNSANGNWIDIPNFVNAPPPDGANGAFTASLRQSRLGLTSDGPTVGGARTSGVLVMDFFGGVAGFQTGQVMALPRLLAGYMRVDGEHTAMQAGQDQMILAPRNPTSLAAQAFPLLFRSGNLYLRAPGLRVEQSVGPYVRASAGVMAPVGGDYPDEAYRFVPPALGGERSRRPALQGRVAFGTADDPNLTAPERSANVAVSGHYGWERRATGLKESWVAALDFGIRRDRIGAAGEWFTGDNIDAFGGAIGLDARAAGGWAELQVFATNRLSFNGGGGLDDLRDAGPAVPRRRNRSSYGNVIFAVTPEFQMSFEYRWLATRPGSGGDRRNHHWDWVMAYKF